MRSISLQEILLLQANAEQEFVILDYLGNRLCSGNTLELLMLNGGKAKLFFNREVHCIASEKWQGMIFPSHIQIIVIEEWDVE